MHAPHSACTVPSNTPCTHNVNAAFHAAYYACSILCMQHTMQHYAWSIPCAQHIPKNVTLDSVSLAYHATLPTNQCHAMQHSPHIDAMPCNTPHTSMPCHATHPTHQCHAMQYTPHINAMPCNTPHTSMPCHAKIGRAQCEGKRHIPE